VMPTFSIRKPKGYLPRELGLYLGQQCANLYAISDKLSAPSPERIKVAEAKIKIYQKNRSVPGVESVLKATEWLGYLLIGMKSYFPVFEKALHNAFKAALDQPMREDAAGFFQGFAKGISKPGLTNAGLVGATTATLVYEKLYVHRREIEQLKSYPELCQFLIRNGVPERAVGSVKRLQKMGERLGLPIGKRGRPPKPQKRRRAS
jgi:hypothetical protein